jgi:hypothetical protein
MLGTQIGMGPLNLSYLVLKRYIVRYKDLYTSLELDEFQFSASFFELVVSHKSKASQEEKSQKILSYSRDSKVQITKKAARK